MPDPRALLQEFDQEMAATRRVLECIPDEHLSFRPHPKSWTAGELAAHIANMPLWAAGTFSTRELDLEGVPADEAPDSTSSLLETFDARVGEGRAALEGARAEDLETPWTLRQGDHVYFTLPRGAVYRSVVMNHMVHHRGQLTLYLRLMDVPVPGVYGPSADDSAPAGE